MKSLWSDQDAEDAVTARAKAGVGRDLALRVYTSRLLGGEPSLVLHGGGNVSVKTRMTDISGADIDVLCVKGSGWDMADIEAPGLPAVRLEPLRQLKKLDRLSDEDMVNVQRGNLLDSTAPNPSVETLLHAFLPHKFIDHTHANATLSLSDQPDGAEICAELYGERAALVPYIMPGFALAKAAAEVAALHPDCEGLILLKHGIFSFGDSAREAYERMIELVGMAETRLAEGRGKPAVSVKLPGKLASPSQVAPILRGLLSVAEEGNEGRYRRPVLAFRQGARILEFVNGKEVSRYGRAGVATPDHVIRTKPMPMIVAPPVAGKLDDFAAAARVARDEFTAHYADYFQRHNSGQEVPKVELDRLPRVVLVPGLGLFAAGKSAKDAAIVADIAEAAVAVISDAEAVGRFESVGEADIFDIEYWSLEQARLGKGVEPPLARHVVAITGGAGAIGAATARAFAAEGAEIAVLDRDGAGAGKLAAELGGLGLACDVTDGTAVAAAFARIAETFGGVDIVVSNAGAAWQGVIGEVAEAVLRQSFELNFFAHQSVAQAALGVMRAQGTGGVLLFNASKQAVNPGPALGPYGLPKAATLSLMRQYAIDHGAEGIRANAVNADRIRGGLLTDDMVRERAKARGISEGDYLGGNLLGREVTAEDVAEAFVALAKARKTTGAVLTVDGGNIAAALR